MPIRGLSDKRRIPRAGKMHLGIKVSTKDGKSQYPKAVDWLVLPMRENSGDAFLVQAIRYRQAEAALVAEADEGKRSGLEAAMQDARLKMEALMDPIGRQISAVYGPMPREIDVLFPSEKVEEVLPQFYKSYNRGTGLFCKGDWVKAMRVGEGGAMLEIDCPGRECPIYKDKKCKEMANLMVMIPRVSIGGCFQIDTGSVNSIIDLNSGIDQVRAHVGRLAMVPCKLRVVRRQVTAEGKKKSIFPLQVGISSWEDCREFAKELTALRREFREGLCLPAPEQSKFEETHLIAADVQAEAAEPTTTTPDGDKFNTSTGEILDAQFEPVPEAEGERTADDLLAEAAGGQAANQGAAIGEEGKRRAGKKPKNDLWHHAGQPADNRPQPAPEAPPAAPQAPVAAGKPPAAPTAGKPAQAPHKPATAAPKATAGPASGVDF